MLLCGEPGSGQAPLSAALMHALEHCHRYSLELPLLVADGSRTPQETARNRPKPPETAGVVQEAVLE